MDITKIGFYALFDVESKDGYLASILITDTQGIPLEFKCTHSIKPTQIQKALYGVNLKTYIANNLCAVPLLNNITNKPDIIFINDRMMMEIREKTNIPTFFVLRDLSQYNNQGNEIKDLIKLEQLKNEYTPIYIDFQRFYQNDLHIINLQIKEILNNIDLLEPFERMSSVVKILGKTDNKFA